MLERDTIVAALRRLADLFRERDTEGEICLLGGTVMVLAERSGSRLGRELETEPAQIRSLYEVALHRLEPVGLVYLWRRASPDRPRAAGALGERPG